MGEQFQRQYRSGPDLYWSPHWKRVEEEGWGDEDRTVGCQKEEGNFAGP
jgi:hypothetical protein